MSKPDTWLVAGVRTPFARVDGALRAHDALALSVPVAKAMAAQLPAGERPDFVVWGTVVPNLGWSNIARELVVKAGIDPSTPAFSTVLACSTSMVAVFEAAGMLREDLALALCGGTESMSRVQIGLRQGFSDWLRRFNQSRTFGERIDRLGQFRWKDFGLHVPAVKNRATGKSMGEHCEEMARQWKIARSDQDRVALQSHQRAVGAMAAGFFDDLVIAVDGVAKDGIARADSSAERLASLKPAFDRTSGQGTITAGNASPLTDGAAGIWVATDAGLARVPSNRARARLVDWEIAAVDIFHEGLLMAPAYAIPRLLARNALTLGAIDLWEIHEAFAAQVLCTLKAWEDADYCKKHLGKDAPLGSIDRAKLNVKGSSLAFGHPFAATGARIVANLGKLLSTNGGGRGLISVCTAGGMGVAAILESGSLVNAKQAA
jgi:acetyl-CoA C-acetyltransferase